MNNLVGNAVEVFKSVEFGNIRAEVIDGEVWFVGKDLADALGYRNTRDALSKHVEEDDKGVAKYDTLGGKQSLAIINESGMYDLILASKLPNAKKFRKWVTKEVLPTIRKTGSYTIPKLSSKELLEHTFKYTGEVDKKVDELRDELEDFKDHMPLNLIDAEEIKRSINKVAVKFLGGKQSIAYEDKKLRSTLYADIHRQLRREFGVNSYKAIRNKELQEALNLIGTYIPPRAISTRIKELNNQMYWEI